MKSIKLGFAVAAILVSGASFAKCMGGPDPDAAGLVDRAPSNPAAAVIGTTDAQIHERFAGIIEQNFRTGNANAIVHSLSDRELTDLASTYKRAGGKTTLLRTLSKSVDAAGLARVTSAFNGVSFGGRISPDAPTAAAPNVDMTIEEIYLDFRTAPAGSLSVEGALYETGVFVGVRASGAFGAGYTVGTGISYLIETYDPELEMAIGGTISNMLDQMAAAASALAMGKLQAAMDRLFGGPVPTRAVNDYAVTTDMDDFESAGSC